ncbi:MAG: pilin, partial [Gammaproteobacteria bacterium]|nr:pilin [Gammaproteobacteria bacterium]
VVAIIGILAAIALPAYQDYTVRAKVSEGAIAASALKINITELFADRGIDGVAALSAEIAADNTALVTDLIEDVDVDAVTGEITINLNGIAQLGTNNILAFMPQIQNDNIRDDNSVGTIEWVCSANPDNGVAANTTIENQFLPANCRQ